jgi:hypothetical protein
MGAQQPRLARKAAAGLVRLDPEAFGKLVGFGLALIGHITKLLGYPGVDPVKPDTQRVETA